MIRLRLFALAVWTGAIGAMALVALLLGVLVWAGRPAIRKFGVGFLWSTEWNPITLEFGAAAVLWGTLVTSAIAMLLAVPLGVGAAIYLVKIAPPWLSRPLGSVVETLAAIPSIAFGFWAIFHIVPLVRATVGGPGYSLLAAGLVLAVMVMPIVTSVSRDVLRACPAAIEEGAVGLGANWWQATWMSVQHVRVGILGAAVLGLARAVGETMAVAMVVGNDPRLVLDLRQPAETMASVLASQYQEASMALYRQSMVYVALVLFGVTLLVHLLARRLVGEPPG